MDYAVQDIKNQYAILGIRYNYRVFRISGLVGRHMVQVARPVSRFEERGSTRRAFFGDYRIHSPHIPLASRLGSLDCSAMDTPLAASGPPTSPFSRVKAIWVVQTMRRSSGSHLA